MPGKAAPSPPPKDDGEDVTYVPGEGDPSTCKWRGLEFKANVPVRIAEKDRPGMIEAARANRYFRVGSEMATGAPVGLPKTAMEYRAYVVDWIKGCDTVDQVAAHWAADRQLRVTCEVGQDDVSYLGTLVEPKLRALRQKEGLTEMQVAGVFVNHGVLEIPWRS